MLLRLFSCVSFSAAVAYDTVDLNGFTTWTQAELDKSSGNNGYATIYARPYFIYEDAEGEQIVVYDDICSATYAE